MAFEYIQTNAILVLHCVVFVQVKVLFNNVLHEKVDPFQYWDVRQPHMPLLHIKP